MMLLIICLVLAGLLWVGFELTGFVLSALVWVGIKLPIALLLWSLGLACCCTLILIPVGMWLFKAGARCLG